MTLGSLTLYPADRSAPALDAEATRALLGPLSFSARYGEPARLTTRSRQFAPGSSALVHRATLRAVYPAEGGGQVLVRWWRLSSLDETTGDAGREVVAEWRPLWLDAAETVARDRAAVGGDLTLALTSVSPAAALAALCDPANGAPSRSGGGPLLVPGGVAAGLAASVDLVLDGPTTLGGLEQLAALLGAEYVARVVPGAAAADDRYAIDLLDPSADDAPVATVELSADRSTAERLRRTESDADALSVIVPVAPGEARAGTLAGNRWAVEDVSGTGAAAGNVRLFLRRESFPLPGGAEPFVVWEDDALVDYKAEVLGRADGGATGDVLVVQATEAPNVLHVADPGYEPTAVRILAPDGSPLVALESPWLIDRLGRIEARVEYPDVHPRANLLAQTGRLTGGTEGVSADMSAWVPDGSRPYGVSLLPAVIGTDGVPATLTRETDPEFVRYGKASLRVDGGPYDGVRIGVGEYRGDLGVWAALRVVSGSVKVWLTAYDPAAAGTQDDPSFTVVQEVTVSADSGTDGDAFSRWQEPAIRVTEDNLPGDGPPLRLSLDVFASGTGPAEWVLDAVTVVGVAQAVPYSPTMGPEALHEAGARELARRAAMGLDEFEVDALDLAEIGAGLPGEAPLAVGDAVALRLTRRTAGTVEEVPARVVEVEYVEGVGSPPVAKRVRLGRSLPTLREAVRRLVGTATGAASGSTGSSSGGGGASDTGEAPAAPAIDGVEQQADTLLVSVTRPAAGVAVLLALVGPDGVATDAGTVTPDAFEGLADGVPLVVPVPVRSVGPHVVRAVASSGGGYSADTEALVDVEGGAPGSGPNALPDVVLETPVVGSQQVAWPFQVPTDGRVEAVGAEITMAAPGLPDRTLPLAVPVLPGTRVLLPFRPPPEYRRAVVQATIEPAPRETPAYVAATEAVLIPDQGTGAYLTDENGTPFVFTPA